MGWREYGEPEAPESPLIEFCLGFFLGTVGFPSQIGWVFISLGWLSGWTVLAIGGVIGMALGINLGWSSWCRKKARKPR